MHLAPPARLIANSNERGAVKAVVDTQRGRWLGGLDRVLRRREETARASICAAIPVARTASLRAVLRHIVAVAEVAAERLQRAAALDLVLASAGMAETAGERARLPHDGRPLGNLALGLLLLAVDAEA